MLHFDGFRLPRFGRPRRRAGLRCQSVSPQTLEVRQYLSGTSIDSAAGITGEQSREDEVRSLDYSQFHTLRRSDVSYLTTEQLASIPGRVWFRRMSRQVRRALTAEQVNALNVRRTGLRGLSVRQVRELTEQQVRRLRYRDFHRLNETQVPELTRRQIQSIESSEQFERLPLRFRNNLTRQQIQSLDVSRVSIQSLTLWQIQGLNRAQRQALSPDDQDWLATERQAKAERDAQSAIQLEYLGHISVPNLPFNAERFGEGRHFGYSTGAFTYLPERDSFLLSGHVYGQLIAEISNPGPGNQAELLHDFVDVTEGGLQAQSADLPHQVRIESLHYHNGRVFVSTEQFYNVQGTQLDTHGSFLPDLTDPQFSGWWGIGSYNGQSTGFYMTTIPDEHAPDGRTLLTGGSISWRAGSSAGPAAILVDPSAAADGDRLEDRTLLHYRHDGVAREIDFDNPESRGVSLYGGSVPEWKGNSDVGGAAAVGERLLYFGRHSLGFDFYGSEDEYERLTGESDAYEGVGYHSGPYTGAIWSYSLDGLNHGSRTVERVEFPWTLNSNRADLRGAFLHNERLYVVEARAQQYGFDPVPVIHVLQVRTGTDSHIDASERTVLIP